MSDADVLDGMKSIPGYLDITPGDFIEIFRFAYRHAIERIAQSLLAKDIMTYPTLTVLEDTPVFEIASIFAKNKINRVPVTDQNGHLLGIVARADIFQAACAL